MTFSQIRMWLQPKYPIVVVFFVSGMFLFPSVTAAEVVERILAVVNDELVLLTDLERDRLFCPGPVSMAPLVASFVDERYPGLRALINKRLVVSEAKRLNVASPSDTIIQESRKTLIDRFGGVKSLTSAMVTHGVDQNDLVGLLRDHLLIRRFLDVRIFPFIRPSPTVRGASAGSTKMPVNEIKNVRAIERLERYLSRLRARANIEINPPL